MNKKKILVVFAGDQFVRNLLRTDALSALRAAYDVSIVANDQLTLREDVEAEDGFRGYFRLSDKVVRRHYFFFSVLTYRYRHISTSFKFRFMRHALCRREHLGTGPAREVKLPYRWIIGHAWKHNRAILWQLLFGNRLVFPFFKFFFESTLPVNADLKRLIRDLEPDLVLYPSSAHDPVGNDVACIAKGSGITSFFAIDNWDNISSKSIFWREPDYLGLWSEEQVEQTYHIHGIERDRTFIIGTPRFNQHFETRGKAGKSRFDFPYVLFAGVSVPFDELDALELLDKELHDHPEVYGDLKVVYRPHPWRQSRHKERSFEDCAFRRIVLDPQLRDEYLAYGKDMATRPDFQPDLNYYPSLIENALFAVGPLTTFLIECQIFYRNCLGLAYDDGVHFTSLNNLLRFSEHLRNVERLPGFTLCKERDQMASQFRELYLDKKPIDQAAWDRELDFFICTDETPYPQRLKKVVDRLTGTDSD